MIDEQHIVHKEQLRNLRMFVRSIGIGANPKDFFTKGEMVFIYGCGDVGRALYYKIKDYVNFIGFIDKNVQSDPYSKEEVFSWGDRAFEQYRDKELTVIVTPTAFFEEIKNELEKNFDNAHIYSIVDLCAIINAHIALREKSNINVTSYIKNYSEKRHDIAVVGTDYGLLVYLLFKRMQIERTIFIFGSYDRFSDERISRLEKYAWGCVYNIEHKGYLELNTGAEFDIIRSVQKNAYIKKDDVYAHDLLPISLEFIDNNTTYIDDGLPSHIAPKDAIVQSYMYLRDNSRIILGKSNSVIDNTKKIEIDLKREWDDLPRIKKQELLDVFASNDVLDYLKNNSDKYLFLTSGYCQSGLITMDEEVKICKELMSEYDENEVIIKPHPVDPINYKELFPKCTIISAQFPFELLWMLDIKLKGVLHFGTSAAMTLFNDKYPEKNYSFLLDNIRFNYDRMIEYNAPENYLNKY